MSHSHERNLREILDGIRAEGIEVVSVERRKGAHVSIEVRAPDGRTAGLLETLSAVGYRSAKNRRARVRRFARGGELR